MTIKALLFSSSILFSLAASAQVVPSVPHQKKQLVYCDHISGRINLYMDMHLNYNPKEDTYTDPEVAVFDASQLSEFPKYLWAISVTFDPSTNTSLIIMNKGKGNEIQFTVPSKNTGFVLEKVKETIQPFNILADGQFNGLELRSAPFSCYGAYSFTNNI